MSPTAAHTSRRAAAVVMASETVSLALVNLAPAQGQGSAGGDSGRRVSGSRTLFETRGATRKASKASGAARNSRSTKLEAILGGAPAGFAGIT
eukprot:scaffold1350_cov249-Pinguiococcus_pyrenoidosus.AAC.9